MARRGRDQHSLKVVSFAPHARRSAITPIAPLTKAERTIFDSMVAQHPHLSPGDAVLLTVFAQTAVQTTKLAKGRDAAEWERVARVLLPEQRLQLHISPDVSLVRRSRHHYKVDEVFGGSTASSALRREPIAGMTLFNEHSKLRERQLQLLERRDSGRPFL